MILIDFAGMYNELSFLSLVLGGGLSGYFSLSSFLYFFFILVILSFLMVCGGRIFVLWFGIWVYDGRSLSTLSLAISHIACIFFDLYVSRFMVTLGEEAGHSGAGI